MGKSTAHTDTTSGVGGVQVLDLLDNLGRLGLDPAQLARSSGIPRSHLAEPGHHVPWSCVSLLFENAARATNDPLLALRASFGGSRDLLAHLVATQSTVSEAFDCFVHFLGISLDGLDGRLESRTNGSALVLHWTGAAPPGNSHLLEYLSGLIVVLIGAFSGRPFQPISIAYPHAPATDSHAYEQLLGCVVRFHSRDFEILIPHDTLRLRLDTQAPEVSTILRTAAEERLTGLAKPCVRRRVEVALRAAIDSADDTSPANIAAQLAMSRRTLQRRLEEEDVTFRELRDAARFERAQKRLLDSTATISQIAAELGFAEVATFDRRFKQWTGLRPTEYRRRNQATRPAH